jgi:hypothetical protein
LTVLETGEKSPLAYQGPHPLRCRKKETDTDRKEDSDGVDIDAVGFGIFQLDFQEE